jgi:hypothetical protein
MSPFAWIKRFVPRGIYARAALILIVPVLAVQLVVSSVFIQRHYENVTEQMALALSLDLNLILDTYARDGAEAGHGCGRGAGDRGGAAARPHGRPAAVLRPVGHGDDGYLL